METFKRFPFFILNFLDFYTILKYKYFKQVNLIINK